MCTHFIMYSLKPYYDTNSPVIMPDCMYKLQNIHGNITSTPQGNVNSQLIDVAVLLQLENRQENILKKLEQLRLEVNKLAGVSSTSRGAQDTGLTDVVISAHPASPPVALLVLQQLLSSQYKVLTSCHRHSSARDVTDKHMAILNSDPSGVTTNRNQYDLVFTLVWKDVQHGPTMMVNPRLQTSLQGEGSIARYLARLMNPAYDQGNDISIATEIDQWVDSAMQYQRGNNKEKASVTKAMNSKLGKSDWLVGSSISLADVMLWGALTQAKQGESSPANVKKWYLKCCEIDAFKAVLNRL